MNYRFIQFPRFVLPAQYEDAIERMADKLSACKGVLSVSQVGGTGTPGISDIDFFVVFENGYVFSKNLVRQLSPEDTYLFTHNLFGTSEMYAEQMEQYTYFGSYKNLAGRNFIFRDATDGPGREILKKQIALEYLLKAWITIQLEKKYGVLKIRNLFLIGKALVHDLVFLRISSGNLWDTIQEITDIRNRWFKKPVSTEQLSGLANRYEGHLFTFLKETLPGQFYLEQTLEFPISKHIMLKRAHDLCIRDSGYRLPAALSSIHPRVVNFQNRLNKFVVEAPAKEEPIPEVLTKRKQWISAAIQYNRKHLPAFVPTAYGMNIFNPSI